MKTNILKFDLFKFSDFGRIKKRVPKQISQTFWTLLTKVQLKKTNTHVNASKQLHFANFFEYCERYMQCVQKICYQYYVLAK